MMNRFKYCTENEQEELMENSFNKNTKKSTKCWLNVYRSWAQVRGKNPVLYEMPPLELNTVLKQFYAEIRKQDGTEYEPDCLRVMLAALHRHLTENLYPANIISDLSFKESRNVLEGKARQLRAMGMGKRPNASHALSKGEEEILWQSQRLGGHCPTSLLHTMWFNNIQHMGLRGVQEHTTMMVENFVERVSESGVPYIQFREDPTKTRPSGLVSKNRVSDTKMFAVGGERCPVRLFKLYLSKRPVEIRNTGRFYLTPIRSNSYQFSDVWYTKTPMGKNTISGIMKELITGTEVEKSRKKLTNHSGRKTLIKKLKSAGVAESSIIKVTGHSTTAGLKNYDPEDENEFQNMSNALHVSPSLSSLQEVNNKPTSSSHQENVHFEVSGPSKKPVGNNPVFNPFQSFDSIFKNTEKSSLHHHSPIQKPKFNPFPSFASTFGNQSLHQHNNELSHQQPVYNFYNCEVNIATPTQKPKPKRKRLRVYSSSEDES